MMIVYKAVNKQNGKIYVGQTVRSLQERIAAHLRYRTSLFSRALRKYGIKTFIFSIIEECNSKEELNKCEIKWIALLKSEHPNGYNMTAGGERPPSQKGRKRSSITKAKLIGNHNALGAKRSDETRKKLAIAKRGNKYAFGRIQTEQERKKRSIALSGRTFTDEHKKRLSEAARARILIYPMPWGMYEKQQERMSI